MGRFQVCFFGVALITACTAVDTEPSVSTENYTVNNWAPVETSTLFGKHMMGYQGWFGCPGDGSDLDQWMHWSRNVQPSPSTVNFDAWPDGSELTSDEACPTSMVLPDGSPAVLFSAYNTDTVGRHFEWMADNGLDGVFLQRFSSELHSPPHFAFRDKVAANVRKGAEDTERAFAIMYDISGHNPSTLVADLKADWKHLVRDLGLTESDAYLHHNGQPVIGLWGLGFHDRPGTTAEALELLAFFQSNTDTDLRASVVGGVPTHWRTLSGDSKSDAVWTTYYLGLDVISPWSVGRYSNEAGADNFRVNQIVPDLLAAKQAGVDYMPVVFPGFSWANLQKDPTVLNQIPREGGGFYWRQIYNATRSGAGMVYTAMFDEVDEGTAMFKIASSDSEKPTTGDFLTLAQDGLSLPSDWYLQLAGAATEILHGERVISETIPISPKWPNEPGDTSEESPAAALPNFEEFAVRAAYKGILGREPDAGGFTYYVGELQRGVSVQTLTQIFYQSGEYAAARSTLPVEVLAEELYQGILQRASDVSGLSATMSAIIEGRAAHRSAAMIESTEAEDLWSKN